jgi:2-hydroxy-3-keto-5-methylthiopentenyl-1-phosphate phosphatase
MSIRYRAMVSSDWNECLAPCGPFDFIAYTFPGLGAELSRIFRLYTGNRIRLTDATRQIEKCLPHPISPDQMDAYLATSFSTYTGVPQLIEWCSRQDILFMINTTGMIGYFQRVLAGNFLPRVPVISAHPMICYTNQDSHMPHFIALRETADKGRNTAAVADKYGIRSDRIVIIGDSGGDGPHFEWGDRTGAFLVGSMTKPSLADYCRTRSIGINLEFGINDPHNRALERRDEFQTNYMDLAPVIEEIANR